VLLLTLAQTPGPSLADAPKSSAQKTLSPGEIGQLQTKAEKCDVNAQVALGKAYQHGNGVPQNFEQAVKWYRLAAHQKNPRAMFNLGLAHYNGDGVEVDNGDT
jgi:TPR repeat protein